MNAVTSKPQSEPNRAICLTERSAMSLLRRFAFAIRAKLTRCSIGHRTRQRS